MSNPFDEKSILVVEDNDADFDLLKYHLSNQHVAVNLRHASSATEAIQLLQNQPLPNLIILDLNMPDRDGREFLLDLKMDAELRKIPSVVFTTSHSEKDIARCYSLGANSYVCKPAELEQFKRVVQKIQDYWLSISELP